MMTMHRPGSLVRTLQAHGLSDLAARASRLLLIVAVARSLDASAIGVAAMAIAAADIVAGLTRTGITDRILSATPDALEATCRTARRVFSTWCLGLCAAQLAIGGVVLALSGGWSLFALIAILAAEYLFMPAALVQDALAKRDGKGEYSTAIASGQRVGANLLATALVLIIPGPLALVLPRLLVAPVWLLAMRRLRPWSADLAVQPAPLRPFLRAATPGLAGALVSAVRTQADKLVIGALLGSHALGLYVMACCAGLGLATLIGRVLSVALLGNLHDAPDRAAGLCRVVGIGLGIIAPVIIALAMLAPLYMPILLGTAGRGLDVIVSILCLAAIPRLLWSVAAQGLGRRERARIDLRLDAALTLALIINITVLAPYGLTTVSFGILASALILQGGAALSVLAPALRPTPQEAF